MEHSPQVESNESVCGEKGKLIPSVTNIILIIVLNAIRKSFAVL